MLETIFTCEVGVFVSDDVLFQWRGHLVSEVDQSTRHSRVRR